MEGFPVVAHKLLASNSNQSYSKHGIAFLYTSIEENVRKTHCNCIVWPTPFWVYGMLLLNFQHFYLISYDRNDDAERCTYVRGPHIKKQNENISTGC